MKRFLLIFCLVWYAFVSQAQTRMLTGTVTSAESKELLIGVSVRQKGGKTGAVTDVSGKFSLSIPDSGRVHLVFSYIGYNEKEVFVGPSEEHISVTLAEQNKTMDEVVVVGYGTVTRRELTGSVSSIDAKQLKDVPVNSAMEALSGRLAGVQVTVSEGQPGADAEINIRGRNSITQDGAPLYIVDGMQVDNALATISPQDIESIDVLKDASATAIYGARGSNGVVIITTKGGKNTGGKFLISYNGLIGIQKLRKKLDVMDPYNYVLYQYERTMATGDTSFTRFADTYADIAAYRDEPVVDWQDRLLNRTALMQTHNVGISGGTAATQYNLSLTSNNQDGIVYNSGYDRKLVNFRLDQKVNDNLKVGMNFRYNRQVITGAGTSDEGTAGYNNLRHVVRYRPFFMEGETEDYFDADLAEETNSNNMQLVNPIRLINALYKRRNNNTTNINGYATYKFTKYLSFKSNFGYNENNSDIFRFDDTISSYSRNFGARMPVVRLEDRTIQTINNSNVFTLSNKSYSKGWHRKHKADLMLGHEIFQTRTKNSYQEVRYFPVGIDAERAFANLGLAAPPAGLEQPRATSSEVPVNQVSFFTRLNYAYDGKYLFTGTLRGDGSSIFGDGHKWGYFPSASVAWRFSQEDFMRDISQISDAKLRVSYGTSGNNRIVPYSYATQFSPSGVTYYINNTATSGYAPINLGNPDLRWETLVSRNLGLDLGLWGNRITLTADVYSNVTNNLLVAVALPTSSGYTTQLQNVGSTRNRGGELQINGVVMQKRNFYWNANFNISRNKNRIQSLGDQTQFLQNSGWFSMTNNPADYIVRVGEEVGTMYGFVNDGWYTLDDFDKVPFSDARYPGFTTQYVLKDGVPNVYPGASSVLAQPGLAKFKDINGDGIINDEDRTVIGHAQPKFYGGFNQQFTYKNFDASIFLNFSYGGQVFNMNKLEFTSSYSKSANLLTDMEGRWHNVDENGVLLQRVVNGVVAGVDPERLAEVNKDATIWMPSTGSNGFYPQSYAVEDASFLRINNITIGYSLPTKLLLKKKITKFRIYATANNLGVWTKYSGFDPEVSTRRATPMTPNVDYSAYPRARSYVFGVNASF